MPRAPPPAFVLKKQAKKYQGTRQDRPETRQTRMCAKWGGLRGNLGCFAHELVHSTCRSAVQRGCVDVWICVCVWVFYFPSFSSRPPPLLGSYGATGLVPSNLAFQRELPHSDMPTLTSSYGYVTQHPCMYICIQGQPHALVGRHEDSWTRPKSNQGHGSRLPLRFTAHVSFTETRRGPGVAPGLGGWPVERYRRSSRRHE